MSLEVVGPEERFITVRMRAYVRSLYIIGKDTNKSVCLYMYVCA